MRISAAATLSALTLFGTSLVAQPSMDEHIRQAMAELLSQLDSNGDGQLGVDELPVGPLGEALGSADTDGDGAISIDELVAAAEAEAEAAPPPVNSVEDLMAHLDTDGNGLIEGEEIVDEQMAAWVTEVDGGGDGSVDLAELSAWIDAQQFEELRMMIQQIMMQFDANQDGVIQIDSEIPDSSPLAELTAADLDSNGAITPEELETFAVQEYEAARQPNTAAPATAETATSETASAETVESAPTAVPVAASAEQGSE